MSDLTWTNERRKLGDLIPWPHNPRQIKKREGKRLGKSYREFNQVETIAIGPNNELYNGHQRLNVWAREFGPGLEVDVRVSSRPLTEEERRKLTVYLHRGTNAEWDWDELASWGIEPELMEWGFQPYELGGYGDTATDRDDQGISTTWQAARDADGGERVHVTIGALETWMHYGVADDLIALLESEYTTNRTPIFETFEAIINSGSDAFRNSRREL